ncbi:hypothetical protein ACJMK2_023161 [Sinanodonta woodiana]|uniref:DUF4430 domain-containing protein n=1 Tax=Sinanodonta woodiana TaxID=1069815 RepID=A0ABD3T3D7_SINWO
MYKKRLWFKLVITLHQAHFKSIHVMRPVYHDDNIYKNCSEQLTYTIRNQLQAPTFEYSLQIPFCHEPFIRIMERAVNMSAHFKFTATFFPESSYFIEAINGVQGYYMVNETYWEFLKAPNIDISLGVSSFYPNDGDHVLFNFTSDQEV